MSAFPPNVGKPSRKEFRDHLPFNFPSSFIVRAPFLLGLESVCHRQTLGMDRRDQGEARNVNHEVVGFSTRPEAQGKGLEQQYLHSSDHSPEEFFNCIFSEKDNRAQDWIQNTEIFA